MNYCGVFLRDRIADSYCFALKVDLVAQLAAAVALVVEVVEAVEVPVVDAVVAAVVAVVVKLASRVVPRSSLYAFPVILAACGMISGC